MVHESVKPICMQREIIQKRLEIIIRQSSRCFRHVKIATPIQYMWQINLTISKSVNYIARHNENNGSSITL